MAEWELHPLSLGEILDRTFTLYRQNFLLFLGISGIPHLLTLALNITQLLLTKLPVVSTQPHPVGVQVHKPVAVAPWGAFGILGTVVALIVTLVVYLFSQGGTIYAVSDLYLGKSATIGGSLKRMWGQLASLFGVTVLNGMAIGVSFLLLIIPGVYVSCRLLTCVPAALLEDLGARASLERSWELTRDNAGRAFLILLLYLALAYGVAMVFVAPFSFMTVFSLKDPGMLRLSLILTQVGSTLSQILVSPFLLIATAVFYYDLRVTKEAFDLQMMMNPEGARAVHTPSTVPSILG